MAKDNAERKAVEDFLAMSRGNCEVNEMAFVEMIKMIRFIYEEMLRQGFTADQAWQWVVLRGVNFNDPIRGED